MVDNPDTIHDMLEKMYGLEAGSPVTQLAENIDNDQVSIPVVSSSKFPHPPNLATIFRDNEFETFLYENINGNYLEDVTRGIQGTPKSWEDGDKIARLFTAKDGDDIMDNIITLASTVEPYIGDTPPAEEEHYKGKMWWDLSGDPDPVMKVMLDEEFVALGGGDITIIIDENKPESQTKGIMWWNPGTDDLKLYIENEFVNLNVGENIDINKLVSNVVEVTNADIDNADIGTLNADDISALIGNIDEINSNEINTNQGNIDNLDSNNINTDDATISNNLNAENIDSNNADIDNADIKELEVEHYLVVPIGENMFKS